MFNRLLIALALCFPLWAGQSIILPGSGANGTFADPNRANTLDFRVEFQLHDYVPGTGGGLITLAGTGMKVQIESSMGLRLYLDRDTMDLGATECRFPLTGRSNSLVRFMRNHATLQWSCEIWEVDGSNYAAQNRTIVSVNAWGGSGGTITQSGPQARLGFLRVYSTLVPVNSRPPVTADTGDILELKFDGNGTDSSGNGSNMDATAFTFAASPAQLAYSKPTQPTKKRWAPFAPMRAGHSNSFSSDSYSMADADATVTCFWQQVSGPSKLTWVGRNTCAPSVTGAVFGPYVVRLRVTDTNGAVNTADYDVGAVAYDDNGVVIYPDPRLKRILGEQKVMGLSSWERADERQIAMTSRNWNGYTLNGGTWDLDTVYPTVNGVERQGTIYFSGSFNNTDPLYGVGTNFLDVFCGGRVGPAIGSSYIAPDLLTDNIEGNSARWREIPITACVSDTEATRGYYDRGNVASPGVPWRTARMLRNSQESVTGAVYINVASPRALLGVGTNFLMLCGGSAGAPTIADGLNVFGSGYTRTVTITACVSDTEVTLAADWPEASIAIGDAVPWGYRKAGIAGTWEGYDSTNNNINFYQVDTAHYSLYYRSGWYKARDAARWMAERWWQIPTLGTAGRYMAFAGPILLHAIDTGYTSVNVDRTKFWEVMAKRLASNDVKSASDLWDHRESGYPLYYMALLAQFDPDATRRATYRGYLTSAYNNIIGPRQLENGNYRATLIADAAQDATRWYAVTNGSATVTKTGGPDIAADFCGDPSTFYSAGTLAVTKGSAAAVGTGTNWTGFANRMVYIRGTLDGQPYSQYNRFTSTATTATTGTLLYPWAGDSITNYRIQAANIYAAVEIDRGALGTVSVNASNVLTDGIVPNVEDGWYWCTVDSTTQLTFDRPFTGTTGHRRFMRGFPGTGNTAFMHGILGMAIFEAGYAMADFDSVVAAGYNTAGQALMNYVASIAEPYGGGEIPYFDTSLDVCKPITSIPNACDRGGETGGQRDFAMELFRALSMSYEQAPTETRLNRANLFMSRVYGGDSRWSKPFPDLSDGDEANQMEEFTFSDGLTWKGTGQAFGQGCANCWEGARVGGVAAPVTRTTRQRVPLPAGADRAVAEIAYPNGTTTEVVCMAGACDFSSLDRRGRPMVTRYRIQNGSTVLATSTEPVEIR